MKIKISPMTLYKNAFWIINDGQPRFIMSFEPYPTLVSKKDRQFFVYGNGDHSVRVGKKETTIEKENKSAKINYNKN
jgi:hypothetical protein